MVEWHGDGSAYPPEHRQVVGSVFHLAGREPYGRLNHTSASAPAKYTHPGDPVHTGPDLVAEVAEFTREPIADRRAGLGFPSAEMGVRPLRAGQQASHRYHASALGGRVDAYQRACC